MGNVAEIPSREGETRTAIDSFAPEPYSIARPIPVVVSADESGYVATFSEANISTSGETPQDAVDNLKSLILDFFDTLSETPDGELGPEPKRQFAILRAFISRR
ncbi:hypothetical protein K8I61_02190 [bacterium]|nr:hypothetical protein [bacterium]